MLALCRLPPCLLLLLVLCSVSGFRPQRLLCGRAARYAANGNVEVPSTGKKNKKYEQLLDAVEFERSNEPSALPMEDDPLLPLVHTVIEAADMRKASSMSAFRISHITEITTFMVIIEGNSRPQNQVNTFVTVFFHVLIYE